MTPVCLPDSPIPVTPEIELSEEEERWAPHLRAWRKTNLGLLESYRQEGLDEAATREALAKPFNRAKQQVKEQTR